MQGGDGTGRQTFQCRLSSQDTGLDCPSVMNSFQFFGEISLQVRYFTLLISLNKRIVCALRLLSMHSSSLGNHLHFVRAILNLWTAGATCCSCPSDALCSHLFSALKHTEHCEALCCSNSSSIRLLLYSSCNHAITSGSVCVCAHTHTRKHTRTKANSVRV